MRNTKQCVKCGLHLKEEKNKLRCDKCMEKVMEELEGKADRNYEYYFKWNLKQMKKTFTGNKNV